ncbi:MAG: hypothetical protein IJU50_09100, partial [Lachnospiraceae bacterium]|nr:hypothetical protein [Lachnospiraceae bacterium]
NAYQTQPGKMNSKTAAIISWLTPIGLLVAFLAGDPNDPYLRFHLNQGIVHTLAWVVTGVVGAICGVLGTILSVVIIGFLFFIPPFAMMGYLFVAWLIAFVGACNGQMTPQPGIGQINILK